LVDFLFVIFLFLIVKSTFAREECVRGEGRLTCSSNEDKVRNVVITLMDKDRWNPDDKMGIALSEKDGTFVVQGCGSDFGSWNSPDPYLLIFHFCNRPEGEMMRLNLDKVFFPEPLEIGEISLNPVKTKK